ncbi:hypothetical protein [Kiloniella litopenaei]|uniref:hypothetical protein n=1 Tax=Kiloniella litopenaei TaxID=1549748 RepID=UPI003BACBD7A
MSTEVKKTYHITKDGWFNDTFYKEGTPLQLTEREARYGLLEGMLVLAAKKAKAAK